MSLTTSDETRSNTRARYYRIGTVVCAILTVLCFWKMVFAVPAFGIGAVVLSRLAIRNGADKLQMNVLAVVCILLCIPVLIVLPFVLINLPHLGVGGISLER